MTEHYVELHASSAFSFLEAASLPESLIERAAELEMPAMALLDRNGFYGSARFHTLGRKKNVRAHVGAEISIKDFGPRLTPPEWLPHQYPSEPARLPLLCTSRTGYQNLCQMITKFKMREPVKSEGAATFDDLQEFSDGLICLTGGDEGPLTASLLNGGEKAGVMVVERLISIFGRENVYIELQRHREREEEWRNQAAIRIARSLNLPVAGDQWCALRDCLRTRGAGYIHRHPPPYRPRSRRTIVDPQRRTASAFGERYDCNYSATFRRR